MVYILMYLEYHTVVVLCQFFCFWKKHVRLLPQPPFSFLFCAKTEKNCADKKSACKCCEETRQTYFQSRRGNSILFSDIQTVIPFKVFKVCDECDIACNECDIACDKCDIACDTCNECDKLQRGRGRGQYLLSH